MAKSDQNATWGSFDIILLVMFLFLFIIITTVIFFRGISNSMKAAA